MTTELLTANQAADIIPRSPSTIQKWCADGTIPDAQKIRVGRTDKWVIPRESVELVASQTPSVAETKRLTGAKSAATRSKRKRQSSNPHVLTQSAIDKLEPVFLQWLDAIKRHDAPGIRAAFVKWQGVTG